MFSFLRNASRIISWVFALLDVILSQRLLQAGFVLLKETKQKSKGNGKKRVRTQGRAVEKPLLTPPASQRGFLTA
jgi:hypothetical protein